MKENTRKQKRRKTNTSGRAGVDWIKRRQRWRVRISVDDTQRHIGYYHEYEDACDARTEAEDKYYGTFVPIDR